MDRISSAIDSLDIGSGENVAVSTDAIAESIDRAESAESARDFEPPKRGRGRPRKSESGKAESGIDSGRQSNRKQAKAPSTTLIDVGTVTFIVAMIGNFISEGTKQPSLAITYDEASLIGQAVANVGRHYDIPISAVSQAWIGLAGCIGTIYVPKIMNLRAKIASGGQQP